MMLYFYPKLPHYYAFPRRAQFGISKLKDMGSFLNFALSVHWTIYISC